MKNTYIIKIENLSLGVLVTAKDSRENNPNLWFQI